MTNRVYKAIHTVTERVDGKQKVTKAGELFIPTAENVSYFLSCRAIVAASEADESLFIKKNPHLFTEAAEPEVLKKGK